MTLKWTHRYEVKPGRWVFVPSDDARTSGKRIKRLVETHWAPPDFYYHLRSGGHVAAVHCHTSHSLFFRADLEDFFGQVNRSRVTRCLKTWFPYREAREMASESVTKNPLSNNSVLPYGFIQSPVLASLALDQSKLGALLRRLKMPPHFSVTVYMDDIVVSSDDAAALANAAAEVESVATAARFPLSSLKKEGPGASVTAFNIEISHGLTSIAPSRMNSFRAEYSGAVSQAQRDGIYNYVDSINAAQAASL